MDKGKNNHAKSKSWRKMECKLVNGKLRNMASIYLCDDTNRMLLLYRIGSRVIRNSYIGTAGGHFEKDELNDAESCVLRELYEEVGLTIKDKAKEIKSNEGKLKWFKFNDISSLDMPHTAKYVVKHYIEEGRKNDKLYGGIAIPEGIEFTELNEF